MPPDFLWRFFDMNLDHWKMIACTLERTNQGIAVFDTEFNLVYCNRYTQKLMELPDALLKPGTPIKTLFKFNARRGEYGPGDVDDLVNERMQLVRQMQPHRFERLRPDGRVLEIRGEPIEGGGFFTLISDNTQKQQLDQLRREKHEDLERLVSERSKDLLKRERELADKTHALETVLEHISQGITMMDKDFNLEVANSRFHELAEIPVSLGKRGTPFSDFMRYNAERGEYGTGDVEKLVNERVELAKKRESHCFERKRPDGTVLEVQGRPTPEGGFVTTFTDITKRTQYEEELRQLQKNLEQKVLQRTQELYESQQTVQKKAKELQITLENISQGISYVNNDLEMVFCNSRFLELLEFPPELGEPGTPFDRYIRINAERGEYGPGDIEEQVRERVELAKKHTPHHFQRTRPDGTVIDIRGIPLPDGGFVTTYTDVTVQTNAKEELRLAKRELEQRVDERTFELLQREKESEEKSALLEATVEHITQGISVFDKNMELLVFNKRFLKELGFPENLGRTGTNIESFFRYNAERGEYGEGNVDRLVQERLDLAKMAEPHSFERRRPDGSVLQIIGRPMPDAIGGFVTTYTDITELVQTQEKLAEATQKAEHANRAKSDFLSRMSHELRTPLNAIIGFSQLLELYFSKNIEDKQKEYIANILGAGNHLLDLINEILDLSKIEAGRVSLEMEQVDISSLVIDSVDLVKPLSKDQDIELQIGRLETKTLCTDEKRLKQIIVNLLSNAIKYNRPGGNVLIECHEQKTDKSLIISVKDTGIGIPDDKEIDLFEPFNRFSAEDTDIEGTGLGLSICKKLIELMGGTISYERNQDIGSTFSITIPYS
jgi:two-component system cell cycle sensor histidine kinase PleC